MMTIEDAKEAKIIAENKIVGILNELEKITECSVKRITFEKVTEEGFGREAWVTTESNVNILLTIK